MEWKCEADMKFCIDAIEQGVGEGVWGTCAVLRRNGEMCSIGLIARASGALKPDYDDFDEAPPNLDYSSEANVDAIRFMKGLGFSQPEIETISGNNDRLGYEAVIDHLRSFPVKESVHGG